MKPVEIGGRAVGPGYPCFVIAEAGVNHNGDMKIAKELIDKAAEAGADAVKFQSFITEELITPDAMKAGYQVESTGQAGSQYDMLKALELGADDHAELKAHCDERRIIYLCTPYEKASVDMLDELGVAAFKVASTDTTNVPFLGYMAAKGRPVILSTGMSTLGEVEEAVDALEGAGLANKIVILHCTSEYPAPFDELNLRAMHTLERAFGHPVGFSDHTPGVGAGPWAVALGAHMLEKHFTLNRAMRGPDHKASVEPAQLAELVRTVRDVEDALGDGIKRIVASERPNKDVMQKSLVASRAIAAGDEIVADDLTAKRPGTGLAPSWLGRVVGKRAARDIGKNRTLTLSDVDWDEE